MGADYCYVELFFGGASAIVLFCFVFIVLANSEGEGDASTIEVDALDFDKRMNGVDVMGACNGKKRREGLTPESSKICPPILSPSLTLSFPWQRVTRSSV